MARRFEENLSDLPSVDHLDWELWTRVEGSLQPYLPALSTGSALLFTASDSRGHYDTSSVEALRAEVAEQEEAPTRILLKLSGGYTEAHHFVYLWASPETARGTLSSTEEAFVNHLAVRIRAIFAQAHKRAVPQPTETADEAAQRAAENHALDVAEQPRRVNVVTDVLPPQKKREWRDVFNHPLLVSIVGGTAASVLAAVILYLFFG